ncbi:hypothetical protein GX865_03770 [Candidatus Saccharibacteria bacterium]|jgi:hypothetical protein|nr:hypothetical protein [Candidatus Saccharibacteria bacterium]
MKKKPKATPAIRKKAFDRTMTQARSHMNGPQKIFSSIIHARPLGIIGDLLASTIARPIPLIGGMIGMILSLALIYGTAKNIGYEVSSFEGIAGFVIGWLIGAITEFFQLLAGFKKK